MLNIAETLKELCGADGVGSDTRNAAETALKYLRKYDADAYIDDFGNVRGFIAGDKSKPAVLLDAHIDEIGLVVTYINDDGFLKVGAAGGVDRRILPARSVTVHGKKNVHGIIAAMPPHAKADDKKTMKIDDIFIDIGYSKAEAENIVSLGDTVTFDGVFTHLQGTRYSGKAIDDRAGVTVILAALDMLDTSSCGVEVQFTSCEEVGERGAMISAYHSEAEYAIAVDVSFGETPDFPPPKGFELGGGVMIGVSPYLNRAMSEELKTLAEKNNLPYQIEVMPRDTGTDADCIGVSRGGKKTALLSVAERYMHTPVEVVDIKDIETAAELIALYLKK